MIQRHFARRLSCSSPALPYCARAFVRGSKLQWHRSSSATSAASDSSSEAAKDQKRISMVERRSMVESFVNKYRALNSGKFPTVKEACKEVGGSHYTVRMVVQELQYKSQIPTIDMRKEPRTESETKKNVEPLTNIDDISSYQIATEADTIAYTEEVVKRPRQDQESTMGELEFSDYCNKVTEAPITGEGELRETEIPSVVRTTSDVEALKNESPPLSISLEKQTVHINESLPDYETVLRLTRKAEVESLSIHTGYCNVDGEERLKQDTLPSVSEGETPFVETVTSSNDKLEALTEESDSRNEEPECDAIMFKDNQLEQSPESEKLTRDLPDELTGDADSHKRSFTWKSLKSLADGILNLWKKW